MQIRKLNSNEKYPMHLLLLADPSEELIQKYLKKGECYVVELNTEIIGVYVLLPTSAENIELVNIAVAEKYQAKGFGKRLVLHAIQNYYE